MAWKEKKKKCNDISLKEKYWLLKIFHAKTSFISLTVKEGTINTLVGNHNKILNVYQDVTLKWATQLPHIPVSVKVANLQ